MGSRDGIQTAKQIIEQKGGWQKPLTSFFQRQPEEEDEEEEDAKDARANKTKSNESLPKKAKKSKKVEKGQYCSGAVPHCSGAVSHREFDNPEHESQDIE